MGSLKLTTASSGSVILSPANTASDVTITVPAVTGTMLTTASAGSVLQVVQATYSTQVQVASTTFTDTGLTASITPSSSSNKILVLINQHIFVTRSTNAAITGSVQLLRNGSSVFNFGDVLEAAAGTNTNGVIETLLNSGLAYVDSPSSTSSVTYKTQIKCNTTANSGSAYAQISNNPSLITLLEIAG